MYIGLLYALLFYGEATATGPSFRERIVPRILEFAKFPAQMIFPPKIVTGSTR